MGHEAFGDEEPCIFSQVRFGVAHGGIHALDLHHFHLAFRALVHKNLGHGVEDAGARSLALAIVLFHISHLGVFADVEAVDAVVAAVAIAVIVDAAPGDDAHLGALADVKIVVNHVVQAAFGHDHGNVNGLVLREGHDANVDAGLVLFGFDDDVFGRMPSGALAVAADIVSARARQVADVGNGFQ